jgi:tetratricopeptide (TPR) repeat protein
LRQSKAAAASGADIAKAIASLPPDVRANCMAAAASAQTGDPDLTKTARLIRTCLASRDLPVALRVSMLEGLASNEVALRNNDAAIEAQSAAIDLESAPTDMQLFYLANLYDVTHRYKEGLATLDRIRAAHESRHDLDATFGVPYHLELGKNLAATGHPHDAIANFSTVISATPALAAAYALRAQNREVVGDKDGARADYIEFARWAAEDSIDANTRAKLANIGIDAASERRHPFGNANPLLERAQQSAKDAQQALTIADTAQAKAKAYWDLSAGLDESGRREQALAAIDKAIALAPDDVRFRQSKITTLVGLNRIDDALAAAAPLLGQMHHELMDGKDPADVSRKYAELTGSLCWGYILKRDWPNAVAMIADTAYGADDFDRDYLAALYLIVRARGESSVPANAYFEDYIRRSIFRNGAQYRQALLQYVRGRVPLKTVYAMIDVIASPTARQNALAEAWMMAAGYERFVKHDEAAARVFRERINDLRPFGTNEWMMVQYGGV